MTSKPTHHWVGFCIFNWSYHQHFMKKLLLLLIFLFPLWGSGGFAQGDFTRIYHPIINEAELAIVDTSYYEALDFYKAAFANVQKPFAKDYYNAAICAAMVGKLPLTFEYLEKIVEKGYPADSLRKDVFFHYVADTCKRWNDFEKRMSLVKPTINWAIRDSLKSYYTLVTKVAYTPLTPELRQHFRDNFNKDTLVIIKVDGTKEVFNQVVFRDSLYFFGSLPEKLKKQQDSLRNLNRIIYTENTRNAVQRTINLIWANGYPDETMIGLSGIDSRLKNKYLPYSNYQLSINDLLLNNSIVNFILGSTPVSYDEGISPIFIQAIRDGKLIPHHFTVVNPAKISIDKKNADNTPDFYSMGRVNILQLQLESNLDCKNAKNVENKKIWKRETFPIYSEAEINEKRTEIGLEKLADAYRKAFFKANATPFIINGGRYLSELSYVSSCEVLEKILNEGILTR